MSEINEFEQRLKSAKNKFQLSTGLNLETLNTILSETNNIWAAAQIQPQAWKNENLAMKTQVFFIILILSLLFLLPKHLSIFSIKINYFPISANKF